MAVNACLGEVLQAGFPGLAQHPPAPCTECRFSKASRGARAAESLARGQGGTSLITCSLNLGLILLLAITKLVLRNILLWDFAAKSYFT